jgi:hypothetical protein
MFLPFLRVFGLTIAALLVSATPALADIETATATTTCSTYSLSVSASGMLPATSNSLLYIINVSPVASGFPITGEIDFVASESGTFSDTITGSFPALAGSYTFSGTATLVGPNKGGFPTQEISFSPSSLTCAPPTPPPCSAQSINSSNFNGTPINGGAYIWFNANFTASGIPSSGATVSLTNSTIDFTQSGTPYQLSAPNAQVVFSPSATCSSTTFNTMTNTWTTTVPVKGDDEIFLTGLAWPVPAGGLGGGINPVNWQGSFSTNGASGISLQWKWGAAVYSVFTTDYNALAVKPGHQTACGQSNGDHAGTPEGFNNSNRRWSEFVVGGARGGGGSNWTGSWSSTQSVSPMCQSSSSFRSSQTPASFATPPSQRSQGFTVTNPEALHWFNQ